MNSEVQFSVLSLGPGHWPTLFYSGRCLKYPGPVLIIIHCFTVSAPRQLRITVTADKLGLGWGGADWWLPRGED